ncbi:amino acid carrier protein [Desulfofundulus thermobenzoicus]|uniref:Amino acid carrier protein n=1 Tax=Desulfofundulus thermobenzoicus TaxID=29376 RepID=A0A6N7INV1_9FIRM|nr:sodium:alanine symporter family protein [Desulfofundulus thermobenzoicus]MQL51705.1 amino acid carrier protein [Desulfofundulus thermobenzoicus]
MTYTDIITKLSGIVWGPYLIVLLIGTGVLFTIRTGFIQFTKFGLVARMTIKNFTKKQDGKGEGEISSIQALFTALASTVGIGSIAGVATAIAIGGPGAMLWMWISALVGMATKFSEITLAMNHREKDEAGIVRGGAMYIWKNALKKPFIGAFFAAGIVFVAYVNCNMVQVNTAAQALQEYGVPTIVTGVILAAITALVVFGGIKRLGKVSEVLVLVTKGLYILCALAILIVNIPEIPAALALIVKSAFGGQQAVGGFAGASVAAAVRYGVARGVFSNEAGCGTAPIAHAAAKVKHPVEQGLYGIMEVFLTTFVVGTCTALAIVITGAWQSGKDGAVLTATAFGHVFGPIGNIIVTLSVVLFAYATLLGWSWYGETAASYLFGKKVIIPYRILWVAFVIVGAISSLKALWLTADFGLGLIVLANVVALLLMNGEVARLTNEFFSGNLVGIPQTKGKEVKFQEH